MFSTTGVEAAWSTATPEKSTIPLVLSWRVSTTTSSLTLCRAFPGPIEAYLGLLLELDAFELRSSASFPASSVLLQGLL